MEYIDFERIRDMLQFVNSKGDDYTFAEFVEYCSEYDFRWFNELVEYATPFFAEYLKSRNERYSDGRES